MGIEHLQEFIEKECSKACQPVDLLKLAREHTQQQLQKRGAPLRSRNLSHSRFHVVVDAESCLDRLYGGYYSDWACGGQWNRMMHFLNNMMQACHSANMELVMFFNGALEGDRIQQWYSEQIEVKKKVAQVHKHINNKGTPPPKVWWIPPVGLRSALRLVLRQFKIPVVCSLDDHHQEVIAYTRENFFHGVIAQHSVYAIFDPPRYFGAEHMKLTYHNSFETTEYVVDEVARTVDLHPKRLPIVAALLGNHILTEDDLKGLYLQICQPPAQGQKNPPVEVIKAVISYVRSLNSVDDLEALGQEIFKDVADCEEKTLKFRQSVQYYVNGTKEGFLRYKTRPKHGHKKEPGSYPGPSEESQKGVKAAAAVHGAPSADSTATTDVPESSPDASAKNSVERISTESPVTTSAETSAETPAETSAETSAETPAAPPAETSTETSVEISAETSAETSAEISAETSAETSAEISAETSAEISAETSVEPPAETSVEPPAETPAESPAAETLAETFAETPTDETPAETLAETSEEIPTELEEYETDTDKAESSEDVLKADKVYTEGESGYSTTTETTPDIVVEPPTPTATTNNNIEQKIAELSIQDDGEIKEAAEEGKEKLRIKPLMSLSTEVDPSSLRSTIQGRRPMKLPRIPPEIMRIVCERHSKGLMMPWIYQVLSQGEIKMDVSLEDDLNNDLPNAVELYRYARQKVYAILFDLGPKRAIAKQNPSQSGDIMTDVLVREWVVPRGVGGPKGDEVPAISLEWKVPSIRRLWLGQAVEDKNRRLRAMLTCMMSDVSLMLNVSYVPQHLLILCAVLRYILMFKDRRVLRRPELDAFLATAVSPNLVDTEANQDMKLPLITTRGVQLASLVMHGIETAIFVNDACGAPLPWSVTCPWNFFDGKLFHYKLLKANNNSSIVELCDGQMEQVMKVEQMRKAILEGIKMDVFLKHPFTVVTGGAQYPGSVYPPGMSFRPAGMGAGVRGGFQPSPMGGGRGAGRGRGILGHSPVDSRGGQLQIAGVVVGNWGANTPGGGNRGGRQPGVGPPQVTSVGPRSGRGGAAPPRVVSTRAARGGSRGRGFAPAGRGMPAQRVQVPAQRFYQNGRVGGAGIGSGMGMGGPLPGSNRGGGMGGRFTASPRGGGNAFVPPPPKRVSYRDDHPGRPTQNGMAGGRGRGCTVENPAEGGAVVSISQFINQKEHTGLGSHDMHDGSTHYGGGAAPPPPMQHHHQQQHAYASSGAAVIHSMAPNISSAAMGVPTAVSMSMGMPPMQGLMAHHQVQSMHQQGGLMHQVALTGMHSGASAMHAHTHYGQGDASAPPPHVHTAPPAPFVRGASDDDFGQFEDLSIMQINGDMGVGAPGAGAHPYVSEGVTHVVQHNGRVTVNLGTTLTD